VWEILGDMRLSWRHYSLADLIVLLLLVLLVGTVPARAQDHLLFCNNPERITLAGAYAEAKIEAGKSYTIFFHYKNYTGASGPLVLALHGTVGKPLKFTARQGFADPQRDPPNAGRQAMARYLSAPEQPFNGKKGFARFSYPLGNRQVASGILHLKSESDARLRIYFRHDKWTVPGAQVIAVDAPRREVEIALSKEVKKQYYRIGEPEEGMSRHLDGTYGMLYAFKIAAPEGRKVRVAFSPRGGKGGLVGSVNGAMSYTPIIPATHWRVFLETKVGKDGVILTTAPFGGVFYPVELMFQLM
jgi:hypothetical protein